MEKTEKALITILETGNKVIEAISDDGKVSFSEGIGITMKGLNLIGVFKDLPEIKEELKTIDQVQISRLVEIFKEKFDLPNDEAELKVEQGVEALAMLAAMIFKKAA